MPKFRKRPVVIEAVQFNGELTEELHALIARSDQECTRYTPGEFAPQGDKPFLAIKTLEGTMSAEVGDWIIRGVQGELYPCKPDIFAATYEPVADDVVEVGERNVKR